VDRRIEARTARGGSEDSAVSLKALRAQLADEFALLKLDA